jgi:hypothetical protein
MTGAQSVDRVLLCPDTSDNDFVRITLLASDSLVVASGTLDLAALRQAVLCLNDDHREAAHILECERDEIWQTLGEAAARVVTEAMKLTKHERD